MINILLFTITLLFAHEDLKTTECTHDKSQIRIEKKQDGTYLFVDITNKKRGILAKPKVTDFFDKKNKQVFDTYNFVHEGEKITFKRPETKGPVKSLKAEYKGLIFNCL